MKIGTTSIVLVECKVDTTKISKVIWTLKTPSSTITKEYPTDVTYTDGYFGIPLTQENTSALGVGIVKVEGQINFTDKAVSKTVTAYLNMEDSLATETVTGNKPNGETDITELHVKLVGEAIVATVDSSSGGGTWGSITGTLSNQTDLQTALNAKANTSQIPTVPTNVSAFTNDAGYVTSEINDNQTTSANTWSASKINQNLSDLNTTVASKANASDLATKGDKTQVDANTNDINRLYKLTQGQTWDFEEQTETGTNVAPSGAVYESLLSVNGKTEQTTYNGYQLLALLDDLTPALTPPFNQSGIDVTYDSDIDALILNGTIGNNCTIIWQVANKLEIGKSYKIFIVNDGAIVSSQLGANSTKGQAFFRTNMQPTMTITEESLSDLNFGKIYFQFLQQAGTLTNKKIQLILICTDNTTESSVTMYEPYVGGIPSPSPSYPQEIVGVTELNITVDGETRKITPPRTLYKVGDYKDYCDVESGKWVLKNKYETPTFLQTFSVEQGNLFRTSSIGSSNTNYLIKSNAFIGVESPTRRFDGSVYYNTSNDKIDVVCNSYDTKESFNNFIATNNVKFLYALAEAQYEDINTSDLAYLKALQGIDADKVITITDQNGNDASYLLEYIVKLGGTTVNE